MEGVVEIAPSAPAPVAVVASLPSTTYEPTFDVPSDSDDDPRRKMSGQGIARSSTRSIHSHPHTTPLSSPISEAATPIPKKHDHVPPTPTDSMVSITLTDPSRSSENSIFNSDSSPRDIVLDVVPAVAKISPPETLLEVDEIEDEHTATPIQEATRGDLEIDMAGDSNRDTSISKFDVPGRQRSESEGSDSSDKVDWDTLDRTEQTQDQESDEQTTLLLARLEQENNAIATDPKSGIKKRGRGQSRPPSIVQLHKLVQEQGARSVRFSLLPTAAPMTELDFWAALVRDYPQTATRLPTITSNKIRCGIPPPLRGQVWLSMASARDKTIWEQYDRFLNEPSPYEKMIGKDVGRSFPQHDMFRDPEGEGQKMLGRVLKCYSLYDDKIGYCQGLGFLVGPLLMNMGDRDAFCLLVRLMEDYDLRSCFLPDLSGLHLRIYQFNRLLRQHVPKVAAHIEALRIEGEYLSQWFLSFFAVTCPLPLLFRIYDVIFAEGASETLMRVALSIMRQNEKKILGYTEFEDVMQLLLSRQLWDVYGLSPASADQFVHDFVSFTSLVTRESLTTLEASFRETQGNTGRNSFLPGVSNAASRFLGRLWTSGPKQQSLNPSNIPTNAASRPTSGLLRTPSKQSLSTIGSIEASDSTASTAMTEMSVISRESSVDGSSLKSRKSPESMASSLRPQQAKEKELDGQIEDLLMMLTEMQKNKALLESQLQKLHEERLEEQVAVKSFIDQVKKEVSSPAQANEGVHVHRRAASELAQQPSANKLSSTTIRLLESLEHRLQNKDNRRSSMFETKASLKHDLATVREQLRVESTRSQELTRELDSKDQEITTMRDELSKARGRIKDSHFDRQRLEKTILELKQSQRQNGVQRSRASSKSSVLDEATEPRDASSGDSTKSGGLREFRLGRAGPTRNNSSGPTQVFTKRTSSLAHSSMHSAHSGSMPSSDHSIIPLTSSPSTLTPPIFSSNPPSTATHPDHDTALIDPANAKTAEAIARQELEELRARFDAMRKMMTAVSTPGADTSLPPTSSSSSSATPTSSTTYTKPSPEPSPTKEQSASAPAAAVSAASAIGGFFGWGKR